MKRVAAVWICSIIMFSFIVLTVDISQPVMGATTIYVDDEGGADYTTINEALFVASDGDTIFVYSGTYNENLMITQTLTLIGEDRETTIINGSGNGDVVIIYEPWVNVTGFTITGSGSVIGDCGLSTTIFSDNCNISDNIIRNNLDGLQIYSSGNTFINNNFSFNTDNGLDLSSSHGNLILANELYGNVDDALYATDSSQNTIDGNTFLSNSGIGLSFSSSNGNTIINNNFTSNVESGFYLSSSNLNTIEGNEFYNSDPGIATWESDGNIFVRNNFTSNTGIGIHIQTNSDGNKIMNNSMLDNEHGVYLFFSGGNNITGNDFFYNNNSGIYLQSSHGNTITFNNFSSNVNDGCRFRDSNGNNLTNNMFILNEDDGIYLDDSDGNNVSWNTVASNTNMGINLVSSNDNTITNNDVWLNNDGIYLSLSSSNRIYHNNIIDNVDQAWDTGNNQWDDGYPSGGNFWSDWTSPDDNSGPDQDEPGSDGIVDDPYVLASPTGSDDYPFTTRNGWIPLLPVCNRDSNEYFDTIQEAIDDPNTFDGHTIEVSAGTYSENIVVDKTVSLVGEDRDTTIIDGGDIGDVVRITEDWVNMSGFTVINSGPNGFPRDAGIEVNSAHHVTISNNMFSSNRDAIYLYNSNYSYVSDNIVDDFEGIHVELSAYTTITGNTLSNIYYGIYFDSSVSIEISDNAMTGDGLRFSGNSPEHWNTHSIDTSNTVNGNPIYYWKNRTAGTIPSGTGQVILASCTNINIENQAISGGYVGIILGFSDNNVISNNNVSSNQEEGVFLFYSDGNIIESNTFMNNDEGIFFIHSNGNKINNNDISNNGHGMLMYDSYGNLISGNIVSWNRYGIMMFNSSGNDLNENMVSTNWAGNGIRIVHSLDNIITKNAIIDNKYGINITDDSFNNRIYHNNITGNTFQASDKTVSGNQWDNGYPSGGNYWGDYSGADLKNGPNQDTSGTDGIGDTPYSIDSDSQDNYPLIAPWGEDTIPPVIELVGPINNSVVKPGIIIDLSITDTNLHEVTCSINGDPYQILASPYDFDTAGWEDGDYRIDVYAEDTSDNTNTTFFNIIIDSTPPVIFLNSPSNGSFLGSSPEIELIISDANLEEVSYSVNSGSQLPLPEPYIIDGSSWSDGENNIIVHAMDQAGNSNVEWFVFTKDSIAPEITLNSPGNGSLLLEYTNLDFEVSDENLRFVICSVNQGAFTTFEEPYDLATEGWDEGEHIITIKADDATGQMIERWYLFTIDTSTPSIESSSITDNEDNISVDSIIVIEFSESMDTEAVEAAISVDPYTEYTCIWKNDNKTMTLEFQNPLEYDTLYTVSIGTNAGDLAGMGLESTFTLEFTTEVEPGGGGNGADDGDEFPFLYLLLVIISAVVVAIIVSVLVMSKRKKGSKAPVSTLTESTGQIQVTCSSCGNLLSVNDIGTTMNVSCPFCSQAMTIESQSVAAQMPQTQAEILPSTMQISCPQCQFVFSVEKTGDPTKVQCPNCGVSGTMNT